MFKKVIAFFGKGGAGKSTTFGNLGIQIYHELAKINCPHRVAGFDFDAEPFFHDDHPDMGISVLNVSSDMEIINKKSKNGKISNKDKIIEEIQEQRKNNLIIINLPGNDTLDIFKEFIDYIDEAVLITHPEESALNTNRGLIVSLYKFLTSHDNLKDKLRRIHIMYNRLDKKLPVVGTKYTEAQFTNPFFKKVVDKELFQEEFIDFYIGNPKKKQRGAFEYSQIPIRTVVLNGLGWGKESISNPFSFDHVELKALYHQERSGNIIYESSKANIPFILNYLDQDGEDLPLPVRVIKNNARYFIEEFMHLDLGK